MRHPIQRLHVCPATARLYTATSNSLHVFDGASGALLSSWTAPEPADSPTKTLITEGEKEKPVVAKKRKVEDITASAKKEKKEHVRLSLFAGIASNNAISKILTTADGRHAVVVTSEDKAVTVFSVEMSKLVALSSRNLPKRVVDLGLVDNGSKIIVADKFGDVFGFPLFPPASDSEPAVDETAVDSAPAAAASETLAADVEMATPEAAPGKAERVYQTEEQLLRHLEKQRAFAEKNRVAAERRKRLQVDYNISFTHEFVLGHVSMLLSLLTVTFPADHPLAAGKEKTWIITSDRDEHIRITRYPQTFVIEGFCLGHAQFVKTMLTPSWDLTTLISGGGDEYLLVWDWRQRRAIQKVDLVAPVQAVLGSDVKIYIPKSAAVKEKQTEEEAAAEEEKGQGAFKFAVSGLWEVPGVRGILVGIESVPALFLFTHTPEGLQYKSNLPLAGNFLDAAVNAADNKVFVSVDPASATDPLLGVYTVNEEGEWISDDKEIASNIERCVVSTVDVSEKLMAAVRTNVLYPVATLRKEYAVKEKEE